MSNEQVPAAWRAVPATSGLLAVGESHQLYWRAFGRIDAMPVIALHGGPGSGLNPQHLTFFEPDVHRVVMFDQRGSGQSSPTAALTGNTTHHLVADIEKLRRHLCIERWLVFGVSWGACLALIYSQRHSESSTGLVLTGLPNRHEHQNAWILDKRAALLPERHRTFLKMLDPGDRADPVIAYYRKILSSNRKDKLEATYAVWILEAGLRGPKPELLTTMTFENIDVGMVNRAKIYLHYWANKSFLCEGQLLCNTSALTEMPVILVHGACDWICPLSGAQLVADAIEAAQLIIVADAGHAPYSEDTVRVLRDAVAAIK